MAQKLSLAIITLNEEANLERCIRSVPFADEVVVVDSGSQDRTLDIAEKLGARVISQKWLGFEKQKQVALDSARNNWVLALDADEALSPELSSEIQELLKTPDLESYEAYRVPRLSWHFGRWIRHGGWYPDFQIRLMNRTQSKWSGGELHEFVSANKIGTFRSPLHHYVFENLSHQVQTNDRYSGLGARTLFDRGKSFSVFKMVLRAKFKFIECYFLKRGFLDGVPGLIIAVGAAYSMFLRYAKLYELEKNSRR